MEIARLIKRVGETVGPQTSCADAAKLMRDHSVGSLVVVADYRPLGMVTDRDLVVRVMAEGRTPGSVPVSDVMSSGPVFADQHRDVAHVMELMSDLAVRRIPIVDDDQRLVGVVSLDDVIVELSAELRLVAHAIEKEM